MKWVDGRGIHGAWTTKHSFRVKNPGFFFFFEKLTVITKKINLKISYPDNILRNSNYYTIVVTPVPLGLLRPVHALLGITLGPPTSCSSSLSFWTHGQRLLFTYLIAPYSTQKLSKQKKLHPITLLDGIFGLRVQVQAKGPKG